MKQLSAVATNSLYATWDNAVKQKQTRQRHYSDNDRIHLSPNNKHTGHKLVVKAYNGPSLAHEQN